GYFRQETRSAPVQLQVPDLFPGVRSKPGTGVPPTMHDRLDCALPCRRGSIVIEVSSSRFLLRPRDLERSLRFYEETLGLAVYREWRSGQDRGVVFFLGGGLLEVAGSTAETPSEAVRLLFQGVERREASACREGRRRRGGA